MDTAPPKKRSRLDRRTFITGAAGLLTAGLAVKGFWEYQEGFQTASVFIGAADSYTAGVEGCVRSGLRELGVTREWVRGKSVLLKPNLVEPSLEAPQVNTHPAVVLAVAEVFRGLDAREVVIGEGQGHCSDTDWVLEQSGLGSALQSAGIRFVDLNHDNVVKTKNVLRRTSLRSLYLPQTVRQADIVVSLPKMKTHHFEGVTLSMKNLFGVMPGICYGWPKNVLHQVGIAESILDIAATVNPHLAIVDGIIGMEGDGPITGTPKHSGVLVMGRNLTAVDATAARLMSIPVLSVPHLARASGVLGPVAERHIEMRGESISRMASAYRRATIL